MATPTELKTMTLLPPSSGKCQQCATEHLPEEPHNQRSLFYRIWFHQEHGRTPTWDDATAHCPPGTRANSYGALQRPWMCRQQRGATETADSG